jgi:phosphatidylinositol alpha 1,6-mannosyltransferase
VPPAAPARLDQQIREGGHVVVQRRLLGGQRLLVGLPEATLLGVKHGEELSRLYASLDVFAHTGPYETFGQAIQEAMASGVPVVAPAKGGPLDLVHQDLTGLLVPPFVEEGFTDAVASLVADPGRRAAYGVAGRAAIEGRSWSAVGDELIGHYHAVMDTAAVPALAAAA